MDKQQKKNSIEVSLLLTFLILILINVFGGYNFSYLTWGAAYWFVLGKYIVPVAVFVIMLLISLYIFREKLQKQFSRYSQLNKSKSSFLVSLITPLFLLFVFIFFRVKTLLYGDGYLIAENILSLENVFTEGKSYLEFLTLYFYYYIALILHEFAVKDGAKIISYLNSTAGVFSVYALWSIARLLSVSTETKIFLFLSTLTSAVVILFFGYVEYYPWAFLFGFLGIRYIFGYLQGKNSSLPMILFSVLSVFFHFITIPVLIVSVYLLLYKKGMLKVITHQNLKKLTLFILSGMFAVYLIEQFTYGRIFVTVLTGADNNYLIYSWSHLLDIVNHLFLVAPLIICLFPVFLSKQGISGFSEDIEFRVLYLISLMAFVMSFLIDPELGAARDWDLLSFYGIPCTLMVSYLIVKYFKKSKFPVWLNFALGVIVIVHIAPNIY
ncbi:MAG: hypothetical protein DWP97_07320, partial [Calditrichaeota bacterium]